MAVEPSPAIREWVGAASRDLAGSAPRLRWTAPGNAHWTLAFLGEQPERRLQEVQDAMGRAAKTVAPFDAALGGLGAFDSWGKARVIWAGLNSGAAELARLAAALSSELRQRGFEVEEREFSAHLTLARSRVPARLEALRDAPLPPLPPPGRVAELKLLRSFLEPAGARYEEVWACPLG